MRVPDWLLQRLRAAEGHVPFRTYMDWVLHDAEHGVYGSGTLRLGPEGDFVTAPSMGGALADLLARQLVNWFEGLDRFGDPDAALSLVETGPGEGHLARQLAEALAAEKARPWRHHLELVMIEPNPGMEARQRLQLEHCRLPVRWMRFSDLASQPVQGIVLAHEVLDALAVERVVSDGSRWLRQDIALVEEPEHRLMLVRGEPLLSGDRAWQLLQELGLPVPGPQRPSGWTSEVHVGLEPWLRDCAAGLRRGHLLVIDYARDARRYYDPRASDGTLLRYRSQRATSDPLVDPGHSDLTAHLCTDALLLAARRSGFIDQGSTSQGEALLALGLSEALHELQLPSAAGLAERLHRREELLRLVDPHALGGFQWQAFRRCLDTAEERRNSSPSSETAPLFLREPASSIPGVGVSGADRSALRSDLSSLGPDDREPR